MADIIHFPKRKRICIDLERDEIFVQLRPEAMIRYAWLYTVGEPANDNQAKRSGILTTAEDFVEIANYLTKEGNLDLAQKAAHIAEIFRARE